jgi:hypothetical protein
MIVDVGDDRSNVPWGASGVVASILQVADHHRNHRHFTVMVPCMIP